MIQSQKFLELIQEAKEIVALNCQRLKTEKHEDKSKEGP